MEHPTAIDDPEAAIDAMLREQGIDPAELVESTPGKRMDRVDEAIELPTDLRFRRRVAHREYLHLLHVSNAAKHIERLPDREESIHGIMRGNWNFWDIVPATLQLAQEPIEHLSVATLSFNTQNAAELLKLIDTGRIRVVTFLCSCYFQQTSQAEYALLDEGMRARGHRCIAARNHAKVILFAMASGARYTIESSANLRSCRNVEQFTMTEDPGLYEFHRGWIEQIVNAGPPAKRTGQESRP